MALPNRAALIKKTIRVLRKHFAPCTPAKDRTLLEHMLFACLLENSSHEAAEKAFASISKDYFDLNEVRVSSVKELSESFRGLTDPAASAARLKRTLHSMFETVYAFDVEILKKQNLGQAVKTIERYDGSTPFVVAYVTQTALNGHAIPVNDGLMLSFQTIGIVSNSEIKKRVVPGLERTIPKSKGIEVASLLHNLGVEVGRNPYGQVARKLLLEIDPACKDRLPKWDQTVSTLISDLEQRGLLETTLVLALGEFGRTPKISTLPSATTPGRDHWANAMSVLVAGGGTPGGEVVGATDRKGYTAVENILSPENFVSSVYTKMGIDPNQIMYTPQGRPVHLVSDPNPIAQIM